VTEKGACQAVGQLRVGDVNVQRTGLVLALVVALQLRRQHDAAYMALLADDLGQRHDQLRGWKICP